MQDLQTWTKTTPILALVGVLVLQLSQGQFFFFLIKHPKKEQPVKNVICFCLQLSSFYPWSLCTFECGNPIKFKSS